LYVVIVAPWFVLEAQRAGAPALGTLIGHYTFGRYTGVIENQSGPWWYYVPVIILGFFPWIAFVPVAAGGAIDAARTRAGSFERLALVWIVVPLLFFSFAQTKLPNYIALILPALAIVVALWFEQVVDARDRRAAFWSALAIPLFILALGIAASAFMHSNHLEGALDIVLPQAEILGIVMLAGSLATVGAVASRWNGLAPWVLGATSIAFVLVIAFESEPAAEALKPIPPIAHVIQEQRAPGAVVAIRGVAGAYALMFYTQPGVIDVDEGASLRAVCAGRDLYLVTRAADIPGLEQIAAERGRYTLELGSLQGVSLLHVNGPGC
jgi:4-amino-4-deoxy-L-arabinose transferase-like glycosyltransferase